MQASMRTHLQAARLHICCSATLSVCCQMHEQQAKGHTKSHAMHAGPIDRQPLLSALHNLFPLL